MNIGITRGFTTLAGAAVAVFLIWLATRMGTGTEGEYWATYGLIAAAGLTMALSQVIGGWTKWGVPRISAGVFLFGFLPVLFVGGWVLLARQPADFFNTSNWSRDFGVEGVVSDLGDVLAPIAFLVGLVLGLVFDTAGPRAAVVADDDERLAPRRRTAVRERPAERTAVAPARAGARERVRDDETARDYDRDGDRERDRRAEVADEPITRERTRATSESEDDERHERSGGLRERLGFGRRRGH